jgi:hypothetical protein
MYLAKTEVQLSALSDKAGALRRQYASMALDGIENAPVVIPALKLARKLIGYDGKDMTAIKRISLSDDERTQQGI